MNTFKFFSDRPGELELLIQYLHGTWPQLEIAQAAFFANKMLVAAPTKYKHSYKSRHKWFSVLVQNSQTFSMKLK